MSGEIFASSLLLSITLLFLLAMKWEIPQKISVPASVLIGLATSQIVIVLNDILVLLRYQILLLELFCIMFITVSLILWRFFRDPERNTPGDIGAILSPADGKIIYVKKMEAGAIPYSEKNGRTFPLSDFIQSDALPKDGYLVGISMNFLDVHVTRAPISGKISTIRHIRGCYASLKKKEALLQNERALIVIDNGETKIGVVLIASRLVRNIVLFVSEGHEVQRGERIGMIRFGSQVDLILSWTPNLLLKVTPGAEVKAGISVLSRMEAIKHNQTLLRAT